MKSQLLLTTGTARPLWASLGGGTHEPAFLQPLLPSGVHVVAALL